MKTIISHALVAIIFGAVGWFAGRTYMQYQISTALVSAFSTTASALSGSAPIATRQPETPPDRSVLAKVSLTHARLDPARRPIGCSELIVHAKNETSVAIQSIKASYKYQTPGRSVPWDSRDDVYFLIAGGLEPGEERDVSGSAGFSGMCALREAIRKNPEAVLSASVVDADDAQGKSLIR